MAIQSSFKEKTADKVKEPKHYKVIMYNDEFTTMDFVVEVLVTIFKKETSLSYKPIDESLAVRIRPEESRSFLKDMGIDGEMFSTPSHSKDSISLILEEGTCFVGDLEPLEYVDAYDNKEMLKADWEKVLSYHPRAICYAHVNEKRLQEGQGGKHISFMEKE